MPNTTVVLGDSNGEMKTYGVTDAAGQITFDNAPANATITAATTCLRSGSTTTNYSIDVQLDVNGSAVLSLDNCSSTGFISPYPSGSGSPIGTVTLNITNTPSKATLNQITTGRVMSWQLGSVITRQTVTVTEGDLDNDGKFSIIVISKDANNNSIANGVLLDQTFTDGMTVNIQMQPMSFVQYQISNLPNIAVALQPSMYINRSGKQGIRLNQSYSLLSAPSSTTVEVPYIPGFGNSVDYQIDVDLDQDHDGVADSHQSLGLGSSVSPPSNQTFDLGKALLVPSVTVTNADSATPTFSWSGVDPAATSISFTVGMRSSTTDWHLGPRNLLRSRTSIRFPELPDSLDLFRPTQVDYLFVYTSSHEGSVSKSSFGSYQAPNP